MSKVGMIELGIFAKTFPGKDPLGVLTQVNAAGFATTQFNMACCGLPSLPFAIDQATIASIAKARTMTGVSLCALSATFNMIHPDRSVRAAGLESLDVLAAAARRLAIPLLTLCTGTRDQGDQWRHHPDNHTPAAWSDLVASMTSAIEIAERHDVRLGIEPELGNVVDSAKAARRLLDELGSDRLRIVLDPANLFETASPAEQYRLIDQALDLLAPAIALAHAKDRARDGSFATAGQGVLDFRHYLHALRLLGFSGPLIAHGLAADEAAGVADFLQARLLQARAP